MINDEFDKAQNRLAGTDVESSLDVHVRIGEGDRVLLSAGASYGETILPLNGMQAALLGRALLSASVALHAGETRPPEGTKLYDCQFPIIRWIAARSGHNGLPIFTAVLPGDISLTFQLDEASVGKCGSSLVDLAGERPLWDNLLDGDDLPQII